MRPLCVRVVELMTPMRAVSMIAESVNLHKGVARTTAHRGTLRHMCASCADRPLLAGFFSQRGQHVAEHHRSCDIAGAERDNVERRNA